MKVISSSRVWMKGWKMSWTWKTQTKTVATTEKKTKQKHISIRVFPSRWPRCHWSPRRWWRAAYHLREPPSSFCAPPHPDVKERKAPEAEGPGGGAVAVGPSSLPRRWQINREQEWQTILIHLIQIEGLGDSSIVFANLDSSWVKILTIVRLSSNRLWWCTQHWETGWWRPQAAPSLWRQWSDRKSTPEWHIPKGQSASVKCGAGGTHFAVTVCPDFCYFESDIRILAAWIQDGLSYILKC